MRKPFKPETKLLTMKQNLTFQARFVVISQSIEGDRGLARRRLAMPSDSPA
jgi:hypothetical protein